jgi:hypothetical protein
MWRSYWMLLGALLAAGVLGCGKSGGSGKDGPPAALKGGPDSVNKDGLAARDEGPAATIGQFLEAFRTGNDEKATQLLSPAARKQVTEKHRAVAPPASDTAKYQIGKIEYVGENGTLSETPTPGCSGARVHTVWIEVDGNGKEVQDQMIWVTRKEAEGWRVVGVAAQVFEGELPLLLSFEDLDDMERKQKQLDQEIKRRNGHVVPEALDALPLFPSTSPEAATSAPDGPQLRDGAALAPPSTTGRTPPGSTPPGSTAPGATLPGSNPAGAGQVPRVENPPGAFRP